MKESYVLDANALLDFIEAGPGWRKVEGLLQSARQQENSIFVSVLNWGEIFYLLWQRRGEETARRTIATLARLPIQIIPVDITQILEAGAIKAMHKIPYVDCVAAALAVLQRATLVTSDRDFEKLGRQFPVIWIARP
jgi:predicted nucleic acid-binding protein